MAEVVAHMSMSLDGFVEDADGSVERVFAWYRGGRADAGGTGAIVCGRRLFDLAGGWDGRHPADAPVFVLTHRPPEAWPHPGFTFVTDGIEAAVAQARAAAGDQRVGVATPDTTRQCLEAGLLDAVAVDLVPVLLGAGKPVFAGVAARLGTPRVVEGDGVTHLRYEVLRGR